MQAERKDNYKQRALSVVQEKEAKPIKAVVVLTGTGTVRGNVTFVQKGCGEPVLLTVYVAGLAPNAQFGFHVHEKGDLTQHCTTLGAHYNPDKVRVYSTQTIRRHCKIPNL